MRRTKEEAERTREAILDAAVKKFSQKGVGATTLSEIAKEAGVTRGAIYWHFSNKIDIFDELHARIYKTMAALLAEEKEEDIPNPLLRLEEICIYLLKRIDETEQAKQSLKLFWLRCDYEGEWNYLKEKHQARKLQGRELFSYYILQAKEKDVLPPETDPDILLQSVICFMKGIITEHLKEPDLFSLQKEAPLMVKQFFRGLKNSG